MICLPFLQIGEEHEASADLPANGISRRSSFGARALVLIAASELWMLSCQCSRCLFLLPDSSDARVSSRGTMGMKASTEYESTRRLPPSRRTFYHGAVVILIYTVGSKSPRIHLRESFAEITRVLSALSHAFSPTFRSFRLVSNKSSHIISFSLRCIHILVEWKVSQLRHCHGPILAFHGSSRAHSSLSCSSMRNIIISIFIF